MTHFNSKEQKFKELLGNLELNIDTEAVWEDVQFSLPRKKDEHKLPLPFWLLTGLFLVGFIWVISISIFEPQTSKESLAAPLVEQTNQDVFDASKAYEAAIEKVSKEKELALELNNRGSSILAETLASIPEQEETKTAFSETEFVSKMTSVTNLQTPSASEPSTIITSERNPTAQNEIQSIERNAETIKNSQLAKANDIVSIHSLAMVSKILSIERQLPLTDAYTYSSVIEPVTLPKKLRFSYTLLVGANRGFSSYSSPSFNETDFMQRPDVSEIDLPGLSSQFLAAAEYGNWRFIAGLKQNYTAARYEKERVVIQAIERNSGATTPTQINFVPQTERTHRLHNGVDLQLGVGLNLLASDKMKLSFNLASSYNLFTSNSGYYLDDFLLTITKFESGDENPYKTSRGFGGELNLMFERRFTEHLAFVVQPSIGTWFNPINKNISQYKLKNSQVGLMIGISYRPVWE